MINRKGINSLIVLFTKSPSINRERKKKLSLEQKPILSTAEFIEAKITIYCKERYPGNTVFIRQGAQLWVQAFIGC
jgi:hypothetical protein